MLTAEERAGLRSFWNRHSRAFCARVARDDRENLRRALAEQRRLLEDAARASGGTITLRPVAFRGGYEGYEVTTTPHFIGYREGFKDALNMVWAQEGNGEARHVKG